MSKIKKSCLFRTISLVLILTFISLDISYAYPPEHNVSNSTLATPSVLQQTPINDHAARFQQSVFFQSALIASVYDIGEYFFGNADKGVEPLPSKYAEDAMRADLGEHLGDAGTEILNIVPVEYIKKTAPDKLKSALDEIGFKGILPDEGVVFILYKKGDKKFLVQVARKGQVSPDSLPGYEWVISDKYVVKYMPEYYKGPATQAAPVQKNMEGFQLIHRGTSDDPLRIVLIMPRSILQKVKPTRFPIGLMSIASCLRNKDFLFKLSNEIPNLKFENKGDIPNIDVRIIDLQAETEDFDLEAELKRIGPDMVGISAVTQLFSAAGNVSKIAAKAVPQAIRVIGGVHISAIGERISNEFENAMADYGFQIAVIREGEEALSEVVLRLASYRDIRDVPGIVIRESETTTLYRITDRRDIKRHLSLNDYPISAHALDLINRTGYEELVDVHGRNRGIAGSLITSRGCPYSCIFCASKAVFSRRVEHVSAEKIFEELKYYYDRGYVGFYIMDDNLCTDPKKIKKLAGLVEQSDIDVTFSAFAHANSITPDVARDLKRSGCAVIALGVESGDEGLLEKIGKKTSIKKIDEATKSLQAVGIYVKFFLLVGLPGQDWLSIKKTAEIILKDRPNAIDVAVTTPYPGSALYEGNGIKVVDGVSQDQLVHIAEPQLKAKAAVDVLTYTDAMFSEEIAKARDLLNTLFRNIDNKNTVDVVMREIDERIKENALGGYPETDIVRARKAARESQRLKNAGYGLNDAAKKMQECFGFIRQAIGKAIREMPISAKPIKLENVEVTANAPVRLDIASGRGSDLFVMSMERGGMVLNAAITLNGEKPIKVTVKAIPEYEIRIHSADLNTAQIITDLKSFDLNDTSLASDPLRLYKAALIEAGIIPESLQGNLTDILEELGGGLEISGKVENIPAGSGLGISSILAATLLKALYEVTGRIPDDRELIMKTVNLEYRLGSYGGWQDTVGGAFKGIKWITTEPGNPVPDYRVLNISPETLAELESRIVLFYTGKPHFAGDILGKIITGYLLREEPCYTAMLEAGAIRDKMLKALEDGDIDRFGSLAGEYWKATIKQIGDEASNKIIDRVLSEMGDLIEGGKASGAGGGGFFFLIAKKGRTGELKERLEKISATTRGKIYKFAFDNKGIEINKKTSLKMLPPPQIPLSDMPDIAISDDGALSSEDSGKLKNAVTGYFKRVESTPGHKSLNYIYSHRIKEVDIGEDLFCDLVLNMGRQAYVQKTMMVVNFKKRTAKYEPDVMIGHTITHGRDDCFLCNVDSLRIIARLRFRGSDYLLIPNDNPYGPESMLLMSVDPEPQWLTGEFMTIFSGCIKALGEDYEGTYNEPFVGASVYHRHGQIRKAKVSIMRNREEALGLSLMRKIGDTKISEVTKWPSTAYIFDSGSPGEIEDIFDRVLDKFHAENIASNINVCFTDGKFRVVQYPRVAGREKSEKLCPEHLASYGMLGGCDIGGWIIFVSENGFNFMMELYKTNPTEFRRRVRAYLSETSVPRDVASSIINNALTDEPLTPQATQLFDLVELSLNSERAKYVEASNKIAGGLDKNMTTAEIKERVQKVIEAIKKLDQKDVLPEVRTNIEMLKSNLIQFEVDGGMASLIILARRAKRENQKLIIGLETDWIPAMNIKGSLQRQAITTLMKEIDSIAEALQSMGLDNVEVIRGSGSQLAGAILNEAEKTHTRMHNIVVMASADTINSNSFAALKNADENDRPFLTGIDPTELIKLYTQFGEAVSKQLYIRLASLLYMTLELAAGKEPPQSPIIVSYDKKLRILILLPKADPIDYETLKNNYAAEKAALQAA